MTRWQNSMHKLNSSAKHPNHSIEDFFEVRTYEPMNPEEEQVFEEFSLITSSMAILIHVVNADRAINQTEKEQIINDLTYQMEQRPYEFSKLSEKFGESEKGIILHIYDKILADYQANTLNLDKIVNDICLLYKNNPAKRLYLMRLCYYSAFSDNAFAPEEMIAIKILAKKMHISNEDLNRIEKEVKQELKNK